MTLDEIRRRPTLPGRFQPSTISVLRLNFCVRDGNRWIPQAIVTGNIQAVKVSAFSVRLLAFRSVAASPLPLSLPLSRCSVSPFPRTLKTAQVASAFASASLHFLPPDQGFSPLRFDILQLIISPATSR